MTAPVPPTVETLAVLVAALDRRLTEQFTALGREEDIRSKELDAWREAHNGLLRTLTDTYGQMLPRPDYQREHERVREDINNVSIRIGEIEARLREDIARNGNRITAIEGRSAGISKTTGVFLAVLGALIGLASFISALHALMGHTV